MLNRDIARELPQQAGAAALQASSAVDMYVEILGRDNVPVAELEAAEAELDQARVALSQVEGKMRALRDTVRRALVRADAPGWVSENGIIYCDGGLAELAE